MYTHAVSSAMIIGCKGPNFALSRSICLGCLMTPNLFLFSLVYFPMSYEANIGD